MLQGKILKIRWNGRFEATIDGKTKRFDDWRGMHEWCNQVIKYAKDSKKKALLMEDLGRICKKSG